MTAPRTLLDLAGADLAPPRLADSVLVVIDAQGEYRTGRLPLEGIEPSLAALLGRAREARTFRSHGGAPLSGAAIHRHALAELADRFAIMVPAAALA